MGIGSKIFSGMKAVSKGVRAMTDGFETFFGEDMKHPKDVVSSQSEMQDKLASSFGMRDSDLDEKFSLGFSKEMKLNFRKEREKRRFF